MLDFGDERWNGLVGGYRVRFDPRPWLNRLESGRGVDQAWSELWEGLHHQNDVDTASYAAVPHLVAIHRKRDTPDWNTFALVGTIEIQRQHDDNPPIPEFLLAGYEQAWRDVVPLALHDLSRTDGRWVVQSALGIVALARGLRRTGEALLDFDEDEFAEMVSLYRKS